MPRDARGVREIQGRFGVRHVLRTSVTGSHQVGTRWVDSGPYGGQKTPIATLGDEALTFHEPSSRDALTSWRNADAPRRTSRSLITLPALPAVSATACQGRGRDGRVLCLGRQLRTVASPAPGASGDGPSLALRAPATGRGSGRSSRCPARRRPGRAPPSSASPDDRGAPRRLRPRAPRSAASRRRSGRSRRGRSRRR